jgi:glucose-1-phosphate cytidylyltransferase
VMRAFATSGFREFVVCLGYRGDLIREYFLHYRSMDRDVSVSLGADSAVVHHNGGDVLEDCVVTLVDTGEETGTGGRVARVAQYLTDDRFVVSYGDAAANLDAAGLLAFHRAHGRLATVTAVRATSRFGVLELEGDVVARFSEKPKLDDWISAGYFVFERSVLDLFTGDDCMLEQQPMQMLTRNDELRAFRHDGFWQPMDTYREYELLNSLWDTGDPPWMRRPAPAESRVG